MIRYADFSSADVTKIKNSDLKLYKEQMIINKESGGNPRYRYCLHKSVESKVHEMLICISKDDYSRPHKHNSVSESHMIIEGSILVVLFEEDGKIMDYFVLSRKQEDYLIHRIEPGIYHMSIPISDVAIFCEVKQGPFNKTDDTYADWAPENKDQEFMNFIKMTGI